MKKLLCSILFLGLIVPQLNAQVIQGTSNTSGGSGIGDLTFGAKAGLGFSTLLGRGFVDITPKVGAYVGGLVEIPAFIDNFYLQPELIFQLQGADIGTSEDLNLLYLHIPLMGKYHITEEIAAEFGPQLGLLLADNWDEEINVIDTKKLYFGLNFGGGYRLDESLYFQLRYSLGLSRVLEETRTRNGALQLGASYFF